MAVEIANLCVAAASISATGTVVGAGIVSASWVATGQCRITLETNAAFDDGEGAILALVHSATGTGNTGMASAHVSPTVKDVYVRVSGPAANAAFDVLMFRFPKVI